MDVQQVKHDKKHRGTNGEEIKELSVIGTEEVKGGRKQKVSVSYTLKASKSNNEKLLDANVISQEQYKIIEDIRIEATKKFIAEQYGL